LGEAAAPVAFRCAADLASHIAEELARDGFDVSETRGAFRRSGSDAAPFPR